MRKDTFASIDHTYFNELTFEEFFGREAFAVAHDWADGLFNHKSAIQNPISEALVKYFTKTKDCKFKNIYTSAIDFKVKVAPKSKNAPKKVKVTIEIT
jgi:hypothetical protein